MTTGRKKTISIIIAIILVLNIIPFASAAAVYAPKYQDEANALYNAGLFKGSSNGFDLDRVPTKAEAAVMLVRLLGKEAKAASMHYSHPFTDVPSWASDYVGYLYVKNLTNGISGNMFGSDMKTSWNDYCTFTLRALMYDDSKGDFTYSSAAATAKDLGLIKNSDGQLLRDDLVGISYAALMTNVKDGSSTLIGRLVNSGAVHREAAMKYGLIAESDTEKTVTLTFSNFHTDNRGFPNNTVMFNRSELPTQIQNFKYVYTSGVDTGASLADIKNSLGNVKEVREKDPVRFAENSGGIYDDTKGLTYYYYGDYGRTAYFFMDSNGYVIGLCVCQAVKDRTVSAACFVISETSLDSAASDPLNAVTDRERAEAAALIQKFYATITKFDGGYTCQDSPYPNCCYVSLDDAYLTETFTNASYVNYVGYAGDFDDRIRSLLTTEPTGIVRLEENMAPLTVASMDKYTFIICIYDKDLKLIAYSPLEKS